MNVKQQKILVAVGILIFLLGVFPGLTRADIPYQKNLKQDYVQCVKKEAPQFSVSLDCPERMKLNETQRVTALVSPHFSRASTQPVTLDGSFIVNPSAAYDVQLQRDEELELVWEVTANEAGWQSLKVPVNYWDDVECHIFVENTVWQDKLAGRILSLLSMLLGYVFITPWRRLRSIREQEIDLLFLLSSIFFLTVFAYWAFKLQLTDVSMLFFGLTMLFTVGLALIWQLTLWQSEAGLLGAGGRRYSLGLSLFAGLHCYWLLRESWSLHMANGSMGTSVFPVGSDLQWFLLIPSAIIIFYYARFASTRKHSSQGASRFGKIARASLYLIAYYNVVVCFLVALHESLLVLSF